MRVVFSSILFFPLLHSSVYYSYIFPRLLSIFSFFFSLCPCRSRNLYLSPTYLSLKGVARGVLGCMWPPPPFVSLFVSKQPAIFRWQSGEYPLYDSVWPPPPPPALKNPGYAHVSYQSLFDTTNPKIFILLGLLTFQNNIHCNLLLHLFNTCFTLHENMHWIF